MTAGSLYWLLDCLHNYGDEITLFVVSVLLIKTFLRFLIVNSIMFIAVIADSTEDEISL